MNVVRYEPWTLFTSLNRDLDRLFTIQLDAEDKTGVATRDWVPAIDIREEDGQFVLHADLPGVDAKDIEITMEKSVLTISGRRQSEARAEKNGYRRAERASGEFYRSFTLPDTADSQAIKAKSGNGVLEVVIPKQAAVLPRRINIETH